MFLFISFGPGTNNMFLWIICSNTLPCFSFFFLIPNQNVLHKLLYRNVHENKECVHIYRHKHTHKNTLENEWHITKWHSKSGPDNFYASFWETSAEMMFIVAHHTNATISSFKGMEWEENVSIILYICYSFYSYISVRILDCVLYS